MTGPLILKKLDVWVVCVAALVAAICLSVLAGSPTQDPRGEKFERQMLPKIGRKISMVGTIMPGKFGPLLTADHWTGVYIITTTTNNADFAKLNTIARLEDHALKVVGVLHRVHRAKPRPTSDPSVAGVPEFFYFDVAEISFSEVKVKGNEKQQPK
jgi:hypothetical protein